jgi:hypothetical protein
MPCPASGTLSLRAVDGVLRSAAVTNEEVVPPPSGGKKWHPGHYMQTKRDPTSMNNQSVRFGYYDQIANEPTILGAAAFIKWSSLEGPTRGDYSAGFDLIHAEIDYLKNLSTPKRFVLKITDIGWANNGIPEAYDHFPLYVQNASDILILTNFAVTWKRWNEQYMGYYIDMLEAYANEFDSEPYLENVVLNRESAPNWGGTTPTGDYSNSGYDAQLRRMALAASQVWTNTNIISPMNFFGTQAQMDSHLQYLASIGVGCGGPDTGLGDTNAEVALLGLNSGIDLRGNIMTTASVESTTLGQWQDISIPAVWDTMNNRVRASHQFWDRNDYSGTLDQQWATGILPFLRNPANAVKYPGCPSSYSSLGGCSA